MSSQVGAGQAVSTVKAPALGNIAARGFAWMAAQTILSKVLTLLTQIVLAWLLTKDDFGLMALTVTVTALPAALCTVGIREVLLRRNTRFDRWVGAASSMSIAFGIAEVLLMAALAPLLAHVYHQPKLIGPVFVMALYAATSLLINVPTAKLQLQLRFKLIATLIFLTAVLQSLLGVACAWMGMGVYSLALPLLCGNVFRLFATARAARVSVRPKLELWKWPYLVGDSLVILLGRIFGVVTQFGDYSALGLFHPSDVVGIYYFAFNLSTQALALIAVNFEGILFPALSLVRTDTDRMRRNYLVASQTLAVIGLPACFLQAALADPGIRLLFSGRWYGSIAPLAILSIGMGFKLVGFSFQSMLQAQGRYRTFATITGCGALAFVSMTCSASRFPGGLPASTAVAVAVACYMAVEGPVFMYVAIRSVGGRWRDVAGVYAMPLLASAVACGVGAVVIRYMPAENRVQNLVRIAACTAIALGLYVPLIRLLAPDAWLSIRNRIASMRG